ncbi:NodT family efflux transporter outer membrane factor (OMF) lipoprotein [Paraburkholderia rhizosphaerae]|uniref:NodT family efflux transporter outer membrane factor (OMF) lipoprotein n=2 Tax=Paraburkholderia rhizosphaerae TaxID=480658 RepID=A0A4V3HF05_9BURK|nr:efflux transporter outer membrane subunit [Paraburkholderia rhizosphaerae]TDY50931.1 NodT family efflux transporter outer membrane factor (OMF) lipoprotein [Paraburkholderia rhizosphaerae]
MRVCHGRASRAALGLWAALSLAACAVGPNFSRPPTPHVEQFVNGAAPPTTLTAAGGTQTLRAGEPIRNDWWTLFACRAIDDAVDDALTGNATLAAAQATLRRSEHELRAGAGVFFPQIDAQFSASRQRYSPLRAGIDLPPSIFNLFTLSASISYALDIWGGQRRYVEALAAQTEAQRYAVQAAYLTLTTNVVNTVIARAAYRDEIVATEQIIALVAEQIAITNAQVSSGASAYAAVLTLENERATLQASLPALAQKEVQAGDLLALLAGQFPVEWRAQPVSLADISLPADLPQTVPSSLVRRRPDILQAEAALHAASANVGVATAAMFPDLTLSATGGYDNTAMHGLTDSKGQVWSIGASLTAPLFQGGTLWHQRKAALAAFDESNATYRQTVLAAFAQVADTLRALEHDAAALDAQTRAVDAAAEALRLLKVGYEAGTVGYLEILIADRQYHEARIAWLEASARRLQDTVALYAALGGGWGDAS